MKLKRIEPYITPEHRLIIEDTEASLRRYDKLLFRQIKRNYPLAFEMTPPDEDDLKRARIDFMQDPYRQKLIRLIADMKAMFEKPQFIIERDGNENIL